MDKQSTDQKEEALVAMLTAFRKEPCYHDNFEKDFLHDFHLKQEAEKATNSSWKLLLERLDAYLQNFRGWQWLYASMSVVTLVAVGVIITSGDLNEPSEPYTNTNQDKREMLLRENAVPVSKETISHSSTNITETNKTTFTAEKTQYIQPDEDNRFNPDSNTDQKPASRVLIEM